MHPIKKLIIVSKGRIIERIGTMMIAFSLSILLPPVLTAQTSGSVKEFGEGISAKKFYSSAIDKDNTVWFLTESGIVSFNGTKWTLHNKNQKVLQTSAQGIVYSSSSTGNEIMLATARGAAVASLPLDEKSGVSSFNPENSKILSNNVLALAIGQNGQKWFGTDKGISGLKNGTWLKNNYEDRYPDVIFETFPITSMATSANGDSLYVGSKGSGIMRVYRDNLDAISGASEYLAWGPILMPSDTVYSIHISSDGTQWIGTPRGVARHKGSKTLEGWTVFTTAEGLANDVVQAINSDSKGNLYFGTVNGLSVYDGTKWTTFKVANGLSGNNILTISIDRNDCIWIGTDSGVTCLKEGKFISYR
jgi:ligand-binding sensor domain-containing protein